MTRREEKEYLTAVEAALRIASRHFMSDDMQALSHIANTSRQRLEQLVADSPSANAAWEAIRNTAGRS